MNSTNREVPLRGGSHSQAVRLGRTVRREPHPWSASVLDLLRHVERAGFGGAPRALGFDEKGREVLSYVSGSTGGNLPDTGPVNSARHWIWKDEVLTRLGALVREYHDAAATFAWVGRKWQLEVRSPVETVCHNDLAPSNVVFRDGIPAALIDWEAAAPGPRAWDLGFAAWRWVPLWPPERCRVAGLPTDTAEKARRLRLLLGGYGMEPDLPFVGTAIDRMSYFLDHLKALTAAGSEWEVGLAQRGVLAVLRDEIDWVKRHAAELVGERAPTDEP